MFLLENLDLTLPLTNPVLKFFLILTIILFAPLLLNKVKIPHILGLIIAGAVIGPNGINLLSRDSSIILSGTAGLLYIMFLAGLEIDLTEFKKNSLKSLLFGMYTFLIPMTLGIFAGYYLLKFSLLTSILLASMFASHTLLVYPILSKYGVIKNRAVNIAVGGTMITDTLALLVLAVIVGMANGNADSRFWTQLSVSIVVFGLLVMWLFPVIGRWFFKNFSDSVSQYVFVLMMVFLAAVLAELAGIEAIIGAFLAGLSLNRLIPATSPLMNRVNFVGNAVFIPFFLIGVGMLVDYRAFFSGTETLFVAVIMTVVATLAKFLAAYFTQRTFIFNRDERRLIFGLSNAQAAATLAAVLVGYNVILGEAPNGEPIRLLNDSVLNGTIVMILITCTIASFVAQKGAKNISLAETTALEKDNSEREEKILIPLSNPETVEELINLSAIVRSKDNQDDLYALSIINNSIEDPDALGKAKKTLEKAVITASATDLYLHRLIRYDINVLNGIISVIKEQNITDLIMGLHVKKEISESFFGFLTEGILEKTNITTLVYKPVQPVSTIKRHLIIIPSNAEKEIGFPFWLLKIWNIAQNTGSELVFYGSVASLKIIREIQKRYPVQAHFNEFFGWDDLLIIAKDIKDDDNVVLICSRENKSSYHHNMKNIPVYVNKYFKSNSLLLIVPIQERVLGQDDFDLDPSIVEPLEKIDQLSENIARLFRRK